MLYLNIWIELLALFGTILTENFAHGDIQHEDLHFNTHSSRTGRFGFQFLENLRQSICRSNICMSADTMPYLTNLMCAAKCPELYLPHSTLKSTTISTTTSTSVSPSTTTSGTTMSTKTTSTTSTTTSTTPSTTSTTTSTTPSTTSTTTSTTPSTTSTTTSTTPSTTTSTTPSTTTSAMPTGNMTTTMMAMAMGMGG